MSKGKKFIAVLMGALLAFSVASTLVGCGKREEYDDTKTQLFILLRFRKRRLYVGFD